jgi:hypothetical protein
VNPIIDKDLSQLTSELNRVQEISTQTGIENRAKIMELEEINKDLSNKLSAVELKLSSMSDYETTKKDLSILRSLEFGDPEESEQRPLEVMILERSKALQVNNSNIIYSQVPNKRVRPNKRVGWLF